MNKSANYASIDEYIASTPPDIRPILEKIRQTVQAAVLEATEAISYKIPAFKRGGTFIYFAAFKNHIGVYPPVKGAARLAKALLPYRGDKGNLKFPLNQAMPYDLIGHIASALSREYSKAKQGSSATQSGNRGLLTPGPHTTTACGSAPGGSQKWSTREHQV